MWFDGVWEVACVNVREQTQQFEQQMLSCHAVLSSQSRGRREYLEECPIRTVFQRDRDRILHSKSFRRLMHKTQVFLSPEGDHYRTRLTHTMEVSQVARSIARALRLNEDLTEAIALGHDLGHTPFGHSGERVLNDICPLGFVHSLQSVRVANRLENEGKGLNLTWEVLNGIACHSSGTPAATWEGRVVRYADKIAYMNHDVDDAIRAGVLREEDIPWNIRYHLGRTPGERITTFITSIVENSTDDVKMSDEVQQLYQELREFLFTAVYYNPLAKSEEGKVETVMESLYKHFVINPDTMPQEYRRILEEEGLHRAVCDYLSGMSDRYAVSLFETLFIPKCWMVGKPGAQ